MSRQFDDHDAILYQFCQDFYGVNFTVDRNTEHTDNTMVSRVNVDHETWEIKTYHDENGFIITHAIYKL